MLHTAWMGLLVVIVGGLGPTAKLPYVHGKIVMPDLVSLASFWGLKNSERKVAQKWLQNPQYCNFTAEHSSVTLMPPSQRAPVRLTANICLFMWSLEDMSGNKSSSHGAPMKRKFSIEKTMSPWDGLKFAGHSGVSKVHEKFNVAKGNKKAKKMWTFEDYMIMFL